MNLHPLWDLMSDHSGTLSQLSVHPAPSVLLAAVSKYPDEEEILVPPLSYLKVSGVVQDTPNVPHVGLLWTGVEELLIGDHPEGPVYSPRRGGGGVRVVVLVVACVQCVG